MVFVFAKCLSIKAMPRLHRTHFIPAMRCRWFCLIFLVLLLNLASGQRTRNARRSTSSNQVQSRIASSSSPSRISGTASRRNTAQSRIANTRRRRNRSRRNRSRRNRSRSNRSSSTASTSGVSSKIVDTSAQARIVDGSTTSISRTPWLVQVHRGSDSFCGGSIIAPRWVLTAAHCCDGYAASAFYIIAGTSVLNGTAGTLYLADFLAIAPKFTERYMNMDAALLKTTSIMSGTNIDVIALAGRIPEVGWTLLVSGWGARREGGASSTYLRSTRVPVVSMAVCRAEYAGESIITKHMFCAGNGQKDTCSGDSGGSAVYNRTLFGVTSFGMGCARAKFAGVYTRVSSIRNWIRRMLQNN